jgi:cupin 2 domain-containing protein
MNNLFSSISDLPDHELFDKLLEHNSVRIERIVSQGHTSPETGWYDQSEHEWVVVIQGSGVIAFDDGEEVRL